MSIDEQAQAIVGLRGTLLAAAYCYYELNASPYSDAMYDNWARTLRTLQCKHPTNKFGFYDEVFAEWGADGCYTGYHLPRDVEVAAAGRALMAEYGL